MPTVARRMGDNRMRAIIQPSVPRLVPRIDAGQVEVTTASLDIESGDSHSPIALARHSRRY
jgi:hypothetical protein